MRSLALIPAFLLLLCAPPRMALCQPTIPPDIARQIEQATKDGRSVRFHVREQTAEGVGASGQASGDKTDLKVDQTAPGVTLPGATATGGENKANAHAWASPSLFKNPLLWVGLLCLGGAGVAVYFKMRRAAMIAGVGGAGLIAAAMLGPVGIFIVAGLGAVGLVVYLKAEHEHTTVKEALRAVVAGVEAAPAEAAAAVKAEVGKQADTRDKTAIAAVKAKDNL